MFKFYFFLWLGWAFRITIESVLMASILSMLITFILYVQQGSVVLSGEVLQALKEIFFFWFPLTWSVTLLVSLFRSLKHIFNVCHSGYELKLYECNKLDLIEVIGYGDLIKVWRRWFMLMIWLTGTQMIIALGISSLFTIDAQVFDWFSIYVLFIFILVSGYISFILLGGRCKKVKVMKC